MIPKAITKKLFKKSSEKNAPNIVGRKGQKISSGTNWFVEE
jgi:hypothetical protein